MRLVALPPEKCLSCAYAWQRGWGLHCTASITPDTQEPLPVAFARAEDMPCGPKANLYRMAGHE